MQMSAAVLWLIFGVVMIVAGIAFFKIKYQRRSYKDRRMDYFNDYDKRMEEFRQHKDQ